jgi:menaquinone-dependent protoporphyrinogen oxidase
MSEKAKTTRRRFVVGAVGATALACGGLTLLGTRQPAVEFIESNCERQEGNVGDKVLVTYASRAGSTGEVAEAIGEVLCDGGAAVDVRLAKGVSDVSPYRAVVVGSAIRTSAWLPEAVEFVKAHREALSRVPVAYFTVCLAMKDDTEENRRRAAAFLDPVREQVPQVQPVGVGLFAGVLDFSKLPFFYRFMWPLTAGGQTSEGDYRDWEAIRDWAADLRPGLLGV